jgi:hypothetical protein
MRQFGLMACLVLATACAHNKPAERTMASSDRLFFECALKNDATSGARIAVSASEYKDVTRNVPAEIEIVKKGNVIQKATNATLGERMPVTANGLQPLWAMNISLGKSGKVFMGYDFVGSNWSMVISTMGFNTDSKGESALCTVSDSSGMAH